MSLRLLATRRMPTALRPMHSGTLTMVRRSLGLLASSAAVAGVGTCHAFIPAKSYSHCLNLNNHHALRYSARSLSSSLGLTLESQKRTPEEVEMTTDALEIIKEAIHAVDPATAVQRHLHVDKQSGTLQVASKTHSSASDFENILLVSFGKASSAMAAACVQQLQMHESWNTFNLPIKGVVIVKDDHATQEEIDILENAGVHVQEASHPVPDQRSVDGARKIMQIVQDDAHEKTLVLCCISGGGSALFCEPQPPLNLNDLQQTNSALLASGMSINDMNLIRKRIETGKGGRLAAAVHPATLVTLVLSDILGDPLDLIASGPTVPDQSTPQDAWRLVQANPMLRDELPEAVLDLLQKQVAKQAAQTGDTPSDTPSDTSSVWDKATTVLVGNNELAVTAAADEAKKRGYNPIVLGTRIEGEAKHVAGVYTAMAQHIVDNNSDGSYPMVQTPAALIAGGETTVTLPPDNTGKGGRNQELALAASLQLQALQLRNVVLASAGTDGTDGPTDAAGAVVDGGTVTRMPGSAEEALQQHNAYPYLEQIENGGDSHCPLIKTGPTGTNVADVCVTLIR